VATSVADRSKTATAIVQVANKPKEKEKDKDKEKEKEREKVTVEKLVAREVLLRENAVSVDPAVNGINGGRSFILLNERPVVGTSP